MKTSAIALIAILTISALGWGQTTIPGTTIIIPDGITSDTINSAQHKAFENRISLTPIDLSNADFEIRFYTLAAATNNRNLRMAKFANGKWEAFEFEEKSSSKIKTHTLIPTLGYETFIANLSQQKFTTLPNQSELDKKIQDGFASKKEYLQSRPSIMDGHNFTVELKVGDKFRVYQFDNPEVYARYYSNVEEFKNFAAIQKIFEQDLVRK